MKSVLYSRCGHLGRLSKQCRTFLTRFSSTNAEYGQNNNVPFRTIENTPSNHGVEHVGLYYTLPQDLAHQRLFQFGGFPKPFLQQCKTFSETCVMVREPALEMIHYLKSADYSKAINKYVVYGKAGVGKSLSITHVLHYAAINDWLLVHVPWVGEWFRRDRVEVSNSATRPGFVDLPSKAVSWLVHFKAQNLAFINEHDLRIQQDYIWNKREESKAGDPFIQMIDHGINRPKYSSEVIIALLAEIKQLCKQDKIKTLVVVDGFNAFFHASTRLVSEDKVMMPPWKVSFVQEGFLNITRSDWHNGAAILICDEMCVPNHDASPLPVYQLTKEGFEHLDPFVPVLVPEMTDKEMYSMLRYYKDRMWLQNTAGDHELAHLSGGNAYKLMQMCGPL